MDRNRKGLEKGTERAERWPDTQASARRGLDRRDFAIILVLGILVIALITVITTYFILPSTPTITGATGGIAEIVETPTQNPSTLTPTISENLEIM